VGLSIRAYVTKAHKRLPFKINFSNRRLMSNKYKFLQMILLVLLMSVSNEVLSKHIVGGDVTYSFVSRNNNTLTYQITFTMYRDTEGGGAQFDNNAAFGLFRGSGNNWSLVRSYEHSPVEIETININTGNPCLEVPSGIGVELGIYTFNVSFQLSATDSYMIAYQRCCRNNTINNILTPEDTGAVFSVEISPFAQAEEDSSPTFDDFPPVVICANTLLNFDHSATDIDGDQIVYSFCTPLQSGGQRGITPGEDPTQCDGITPNPENCQPPFREVNFRLPAFSFDNPLGNGVTVNQSSGLISGIPQMLGQFVVGVCATTFRNGVEIGRVSRDFQFNVTTCEVAVQASLGSDRISGDNAFVINQCGDLQVDFVNLSTDQSKIFSYDWQIDVLGDLVEFDTRNISYTFPDTGTYNGLLLLNNEGDFANCKDTAEIIVNIFPAITSDFTFDYDTCVAGPVDFINQSVTGAGNILKNEWTFEPMAFSDDVDPRHTYATPGIKPVKLTVEDKNECRDSTVKDITWFPVPPLVVVQPNQFVGCNPARISFTNLSTPIDSTYDVVWNFGDGNSVNEISPSHVYEDVGTYTVDVTITSPIGCQIDENFDGWIRILESPEAGFSYTPKEPTIFNKDVDFFDESVGAESWIWNIGGLGYVVQNPSHTFPDTGMVDVVQVVTHSSGCTDTMAVVLDILPLVTLHLPNAFTPNNDGLNDTFKGKGFFDGFKDYSMTIWNRWGENIYQTTDPNQGWNGRKNNNGNASQGGVYVYSIEYTGPRGNVNLLKGHVTLVR